VGHDDPVGRAGRYRTFLAPHAEFWVLCGDSPGLAGGAKQTTDGIRLDTWMASEGLGCAGPGEPTHRRGGYLDLALTNRTDLTTARAGAYHGSDHRAN
jgi:hypothetical protein